MRTRASVAVVLTVVGLGLTIAAMSIRYWVVKDDFSDLPNYPNPPPPPTPSAPAGSALYIGVKTFIFVPATGPIVSDNLGGPIVQGLLYNVAVVGDLNAGGDAVIGSGTVALLLAIAAVIFTIRAMVNQTQAPSVMAVPIGLNVLAGALLAVGALLYARKLGVDWSFLVFTASSAFMLTATVLHARDLFGKPLTKMRHGVAVGLLVAGIGVAVLSMSTSSWMSIDITQNCQGGPGTYHLAIGLKRYWQSYSGCPPPASYSPEGALSALQGWGSLGVRTDDGGTMVIVLGSIALAMAASSVVLYLLALQGGPRKGQYQFFSVILSLVGAFLLATAVVLYAKKLFLSLSFVFLVGGGFLYFAAAFILLALSLQPPKIGSNANGTRSSLASAAQAGQTKEPLLQVQTSSDDDPQITGAMPHSKMSVSKPRISALG